jgi:hypothetical protein
MRPNLRWGGKPPVRGCESERYWRLGCAWAAVEFFHHKDTKTRRFCGFWVRWRSARTGCLSVEWRGQHRGAGASEGNLSGAAADGTVHRGWIWIPWASPDGPGSRWRVRLFPRTRSTGQRGLGRVIGYRVDSDCRLHQCIANNFVSSCLCGENKNLHMRRSIQEKARSNSPPARSHPSTPRR